MSGIVPLLPIYAFISTALLTPWKEPFTHNVKGWMEPEPPDRL
jgi:hypothetical protein